MAEIKKIILPHGGDKGLIVYHKSETIYQGTVLFCKRFFPAHGDRTVDQMVQAARSGVQNIAEGSVDAATSAKLELNLYNVARASLEELKLDYQDYLRQHCEQQWLKDDLLYLEFIKRRISSKREFREFIVWAENHISVPIRTIPYKSVLVANAVLLLIDTASYFLKRQIEKKAAIFLDNGGFAERMHNMRIQSRKK